jgi:ribose-phosphate pyrophosphokinase
MMKATLTLHAFADEAEPARAIADALGIALGIVDVHIFPDGEVLPTVPEAAPTTLVYRSLARPNDSLIALLLASDAWRRAGARRLVLVAPYLCYLRQDTVFGPGQPISQHVIGDLLGARFDRIVTVDAHLHRTHSIEGVFPQTQATNLTAAPAIARWLARHAQGLDVIVGPDVESEGWVRAVATALGAPYRLLSKKRLGDAEVRLILRDAEAFAGRSVAIIDDICSSGGTLIRAAQMLRDAGARTIVVCVTHALFDEAVAVRLRAAGVSSIVSTDAVIHPTNAIALAPLLADALRCEVPQ